jgi:hypothetical protein
MEEGGKTVPVAHANTVEMNKEDIYDVINSKSSHIVDSCVKGYDITPHAIPRRAKAFPTLPYKPNRRLIRTASKFMSRLKKYFHADLSPLRHPPP